MVPSQTVFLCHRGVDRDCGKILLVQQFAQCQTTGDGVGEDNAVHIQTWQSINQSSDQPQFSFSNFSHGLGFLNLHLVEFQQIEEIHERLGLVHVHRLQVVLLQFFQRQVSVMIDG